MRITIVAAAAVAMIVSAADARAQMSMGSFHGYLTGHVGSSFGADLTAPSLTGGISVSVQETTGWGAEFDFGYAGDMEADALRLDTATYMVNAIYVAPDRRVRPFAIAGAGVMQVDGCTAPCSSAAKTHDFAISAGGGVFALLSDVIGVRADARYFWSSSEHSDLNRPENFAFWRVSVGVTYLWTMAP